MKMQVLGWLLICSAATAAEPRAIKVSAKSEIKVSPDEVVLGLAVQTRDILLINAKQENDKITAAILALAPKHSLPAVDVKVTNLNVAPDYRRLSHREPMPRGYDVIRSIEVRLTDFAKIEPFVADAFNAGLTSIQYLHFRVANQRKHQFEARRLAVTYAREKAEHLTELTGMKLGAPLRIEEQVQHNWDAGGFGGGGFGGGFGGGGVGGGVGGVGYGGGLGSKDARPKGIRVAAAPTKFVFTSLQKADDKAKDKASDKAKRKAGTVVSPGQIVITAQVTVEFEMTSK